MIYFCIFLIVVLCSAIIILIMNYNQSKTKFLEKIQTLELVISELNASKDLQNQKLKLSDDLKSKLKKSNDILINSILDVNMDFLKELYLKKS